MKKSIFSTVLAMMLFSSGTAFSFAGTEAADNSDLASIFNTFETASAASSTISNDNTSGDSSTYNTSSASSEDTAATVDSDAEETIDTASTSSAYENATSIELSDKEITVNGSSATEDSSSAVYLSHDIVYYQDKDTYDSGNPYGEGDSSDKHSASEADAHTVVNITQPGTYVISGTLSAGQIAVDLGDDAKTDPNAVVTLVMNGADITCTVAPAVIFYNVYECDTDWVSYDAGENTDYTASSEVDTSEAGARVILADGSTNNITGSHVAKIYKDNANQKKKYKFDGAFYSKMSLNISGESEGTGVLNITADNEGLDSEHHLTINSGAVNIQSQDDGINTNEDGVSVTTINGGSLHITAGLGSEGDGVDSNGYLVINGGVVISSAKPESDSGLDSDCGSYINGGTVIATGSTMDWAESESKQVTMNLQFTSRQNSDEAIIVTDQNNKVLFAYDPDQDETTGSSVRGYQGAVLSCPDFEVGSTYYVYIGGDVTGTEVNGLYDASTVTDFTGAVRQEYTGTDVGMGGGQKPSNGQFPSSGDNGTTPPDLPSGDNGTTPPDLPSGDNGTTPPTPPSGDNGITPPDQPSGDNGTTPPDQPSGNNGSAAASGTASIDFYMTDKVNAFSGVCDEGTNQPSESGSVFTDVSSSDWFSSYVAYVVEKGLFQGTSATTFEPQSDMSRAMIWTVLARLDGADTTASDTEEWYEKGRSWAMTKTVNGGSAVSDGTNPEDSITRQEIVTMLWRYAGQPNSSSNEETSDSSLERFQDVGEVSGWAREAMTWAVEKGIINGTDSTTLSPQDTATRAQVAAIMQRYCELLNQ